MPFLYPITSNLTASLNSGSYLNQTDLSLFYNGSQSDFWFSISHNDNIELSLYDLNENLISWKSVNDVGHYKNVVLTYYDNKNNAIPYSYNEFIFDYPLYKTEKILVNPIADFSSSTLPDGNYILSYQFIRYLAGTPQNPLVIKDISPSKTELKLIPSKEATPEYNAFCTGKIQLNDVAPLYLTLTKDCPYSKLYNDSISNNQAQIDLVKNLFFISSDGKFVEFLKFIYEDFIKYSNQQNERIDSFTRIQGIKTYFNNFLISNTNNIFGFGDIRVKYEEFVSNRLELLFTNYKDPQYNSAKQYLFNLFVNDYFLPIHSLLETEYKKKYNDPLKNALCFNNGKYIPIINTAYIDERVLQSDPLTLLVKLQTPIIDDLSIKSSVWISNIGMIPFLFDCIIKSGVIGKTIKISPPDFTTVSQNVSLTNTNTYFNSTDLTNSTTNENDINVSKKINELNVDYTSLNNFVIFSSAELRHNIFKNKMISLAGIDNSLSTLESAYSSSGYTYQYYTTEKETFQEQETDIINSFDGFESYLYKTDYYTYSTSSRTFSSASFVEYLDEETKRYDKYNRDSLVNNTPEHILTDEGNDDYLIFLSMIGHYFDNLYLYIKSLPIERASDDNNSFARNILQQLLQSFGWKLDASLESLSIFDNYLDTNLSGINTLSADERTRQIWNRILNTLPLIYKTKGTEECIKLILSCYGIPSTLIHIKEYGGFDYSNTDKTSYTIEEQLLMLTFKGYREYISIPFDSSIKTIEFKVALDTNKEYKLQEKIPLAVKYNQYNEVDWTIGVYKEPKQYLGRTYFELEFPRYEIGIIGDYGRIDGTYSQSIQVASSLTTYNPDIIITTGDNTNETGINAYDNTVGRLYHQFINPYVGVSGSGATVNRFFPSLGASDFIGGSFNQYQAFFPTTLNFYTFTKGNVQFFMLNSDNEDSGSTATSAQATWLKGQISSSLSNVEILWRIAVFNRVWVSSGNAGSLGSWMEWPWAAWGIDLVIGGHEHFYERLESDNIPVIIQGLGGDSINPFFAIDPTSKFRYNDSHGYSVLTAKGNTLRIAAYDMFGNKIVDNGTTTLPSSSLDNGSYVMTKNSVPFSDRPFRQADKYILSDQMPIFSGEIFNIMLRKNDPDVLFEYNAITDIVPTKYDLWVQRKDDSRIIFSSSKSDILTKTYNYEFSNTGILYFGNYQNSSSFVGLLDKILIWDSPILDSTYNDHCNNLNSYSYTGSFIPHETLYFRMNYDYPQDFSVSNPFTVVNANEYYSSSVYASAYNFGVISYSSSLDNCVYVSHSYYPYQFTEIPYNQTFTISSYGPNKFKNQKVQKVSFELAARLDSNDRSTYLANTFVSPDSNQIGLFADPNDYKNKDIFRYLGDYKITSLVADPSQMFQDKYYPLKNVNEMYNDSGNKKVLYNEMFTLYKFYFDKSIFETIKQLIPARNNVLTGILIEPTVLERPKYQHKRIDSTACHLESTSSAVNSFITSSTNVRPPTLSMNNSIYAGGVISSDFIFVDFNLQKDVFASQLYENIPFYLPEGPYQLNDPVYLEYLNLKNQLTFVPSGWVKTHPDVGEIGKVEQHTDWVIPAPTIGIFNVDMSPAAGYYITGSGYYYLKDCYFYTKVDENARNILTNIQKNTNATLDLSKAKLPTIEYPTVYNNGIIKDIENPEELGVHCNAFGKIIESVGSESYARYLIKSWQKDYTFVKTGEYTKPQTMSSQSLYFYTTQIWLEPQYTSTVYTSSVDILVNVATINNQSPNVVDYAPIPIQISTDTWLFSHNAGTFISHPNTTVDNIYSNVVTNPAGGNIDLVADTQKQDVDKYLEVFSGYSRNHLTHKRLTFSNVSYPKITASPITFDRYVKSRQTIDTTVNTDGFDDNSFPVQSIDVSNINVVKTDNVLG